MTCHHPVTINRDSTLEDRQTALCQMYKQVLERQPYAHERKHFVKAEKEFLSNKISIKRFLNELGHSRVYLDSFYHNFSNLKFLELCFKHFLGRAPHDRDEIKIYCDILMSKGVAHLISTILDSEDYRKAFGAFTIPYPRSEKYYPSPNAFLESQALNREHIGQKGRSLPTLYRHQLGLNWQGENPLHADNEYNHFQIPEAEMAHLLSLLRYAPPEEIVATLSTQQKALLRQAMATE